MTNCNLSVLQSTPQTYQHPWYTAQQRLENTTTSDVESTQKQSREPTGRKCTNCGHDVRTPRGHKCDNCIQLKKRYGINRVERDWMYFLQEGECANPGCNNEAEHVDHCHTTGKVRAMLCNHCNKSLGALEEDPQRIAGLLNYLSTNA